MNILVSKDMVSRNNINYIKSATVFGIKGVVCLKLNNALTRRSRSSLLT